VRYGGAHPGVYRVGDRIPSADGRLELCVTRAEITVFAGQPRPSDASQERGDATVLLEAVFTLHHRDPDTPPTPLALALSNIRLEPQGPGSGETMLPVGVPLELHGVKVLVEGENLRVMQHPDPDSGQLAFALGAVFRVPLCGGEGLLRIADFPPVQVQWSAEDEEQAEKEAERSTETS
jgi:hypothetical protein